MTFFCFLFKQLLTAHTLCIESDARRVWIIILQYKIIFDEISSLAQRLQTIFDEPFVLGTKSVNSFLSTLSEQFLKCKSTTLTNEVFILEKSRKLVALTKLH